MTITLHKSIDNYFAQIYWQLLCTNLLTITLHKSIDNYFEQIDWQLLCTNLLIITLHKSIDNYFAQQSMITLHNSVQLSFESLLHCIIACTFTSERLVEMLWFPFLLDVWRCLHIIMWYPEWVLLSEGRYVSFYSLALYNLVLGLMDIWLKFKLFKWWMSHGDMTDYSHATILGVLLGDYIYIYTP